MRRPRERCGRGGRRRRRAGVARAHLTRSRPEAESRGHRPRAACERALRVRERRGGARGRRAPRAPGRRLRREQHSLRVLLGVLIVRVVVLVGSGEGRW